MTNDLPLGIGVQGNLDAYALVPRLVDDVRVYNRALNLSEIQALAGISTISGNAGVGGATLSYTDGTPKNATADGSGNYSLTVLNGWSGTVTPSKVGYSFTPVAEDYTRTFEPI